MSDGALTVLLVPGAMQEHVADLLARWVDAWLLDECYLVRTGGAALGIEPGDAVSTVEAEHMVRGQVLTVPDLVRGIKNRRDASEVRLVRVVELVVPESMSGASREHLRSEADAIATTILRSASTRRVHRIALIVLPSGERVRAAEMRQAEWEVNVLAIPENRSVPGGWDGLVRMSEPRAFAGFALAHVATVGGLWAGMRGGAWDDVTRMHDDSVQVQRVTVRAVLHGERRIRAALGAVSVLASSEHDPVAGNLATLRAPDGSRVGPLEDGQLDLVAQHAVAGLLDGPPGRPLRARLDGHEPPAPVARRDAIRRPRWPSARTRSAPADAVPEDPAERERLGRLVQRLGRAGDGRRGAVDGTLLARWPRPRRDGGTPAAAAVWRRLHDGVGLLLDAGVRPGATELAIRMAEHGLAGVVPDRMVVADLAATWDFPEELLGIIGAAPDRMPTQVRHTDLLGLRTWEAVLAPWIPRAEEAAESEDGSDLMTQEQARQLLTTIGSLAGVIATTSSTVVGRLQLAWHDEFGRVARAMADLHRAGGDDADPSPVQRRPDWRAVAAAAGVLVVLGAVASSSSQLAAVLLLGSTAAVWWRARGRPDERAPSGGAAARARAAQALLEESERCERVTDELGWMVGLLSRLVHHAIEPRPPEFPERTALEDDDLPILVRTAVPDDRAEDGTDSGPPPIARSMLVCLEDLLETGWQRDCHDQLLEDVARRERLLPEDQDPVDALDRDPRLALEVRWRLEAADGEYEARVAERLVRRGVRSLEGSLRPGDDPPERLTQPGMPGAPGSRVRIIERIRPSFDMRRDALSRALPEDPNWDEFLLDGVGGDDPWSASHFERRGQGEAAIGRRRTLVHGPVRLRARAAIEETQMTFVPLRGDGGSQAELVVRIDTQPDALHVEALRIFRVED